MNHLDARRDRYAAALDPDDTLILIGAGQPIHMPGGFDRTYPFTTHPDYYVLAEQECPGAFLAYDAATGWAHFAPPVTDAQRVWDGDVSFDGDPIDQLDGWIARRRGRPIAMLGTPHPDIDADTTQTAVMRDRYAAARRVKDDAELDRIRDAIDCTRQALALAPELCRARHTERRIQIDLEAAMFRAGADRTAYDTTVGAGADAAVFHFSPGQRAPGPSECVLIDLGAERNRYCADVTRTYPAAGTFTTTQQELYDAVLSAQLAAIDACRAHTEWHDVHRVASETLAGALVDIGMLAGDPPELVDRGAVALFFPHGIGHMLGLGVRDAGGVLASRTPRPGPGGVGVRVDLPLQVGHVVTVEPGCYFVPALIDAADTRARFMDAVRWDVVDKLRDEIHGIRIEEDVRITEGVPEVLTAAIPK